MTTQTFSPQQIETNNQIVNEMIAQLGGGRFFAMTGAKPQYKDVQTANPLIALKLTRNASKANFLKVSYLSGKDLYKMEFVQMTTKKMATVAEFDGVFNDQLQELFTQVTGMYTKL